MRRKRSWHQTTPAAVRVSRRFRAPAKRIFDAWLDPELAGKWLFATASRPMTHVAIDARVGGSFHFVDRQDGEHRAHRGKYLQIVPYRRLVFSLHGANGARTATQVTVNLRPLKRGCELILNHDDVSPDAARHVRARWTGILYGLDETLTSNTVDV